MTTFIRQLEIIRAKARLEELQRAQREASAKTKLEAKAAAEARCKAILAALKGHPARDWDEWISTPEILDALNLPRRKQAYALVETTMRELGWTPLRAVRRGGHLRYYAKPRGYVRGRRTDLAREPIAPDLLAGLIEAPDVLDATTSLAPQQPAVLPKMAIDTPISGWSARRRRRG
jgi:DNA-binding TFAR19-related protein (PDSD5 family)